MGPSLNSSVPGYRVFFSHGGEDTFIVNLLRPLVEASGASVFVDAGKINYGDDFRGLILEELRSCDELLILLTPSSIRRLWVLAELGGALIREIRVVVVRYGVSEAELHANGILSLLGSNSLLVIDDFDQYVEQLKQRVASGSHV